MKIYLISLFIMLPFCSFSQTGVLSQAALDSRREAGIVVDKTIKSEIEDKNYIVFSVADKDYIVEIERNKSYLEYFIRISANGNPTILKKVNFNKPRRLMSKMFNKGIYRKDFVTFESDFFKPSYELASGNLTYFVFIDKNLNRYGEARLSVFVKPNPIDAEVYLYFVDRLFKYVRIFG